MPTSRRTASTLRRLAARSTPSTTIRPFCAVSSRLMQRMSVDLPEPDGPQMTIRSPGRTDRVMSVRTWKCPNHLSSPSMRMIGSAPLSLIATARASRRLHGGQLGAEPLLVELVELAVGPVFVDEVVDGLLQRGLARPKRDTHHLLLQDELLLVGVRRRALLDLRRNRGRTTERVDLARHQRLHARGVVVEAANLGARWRNGRERDILRAGAGDPDAQALEIGRPLDVRLLVREQHDRR